MEVMKGLRHQAIRDLVTRRRVRTQQELAAALRERGFRATQATVSRDIRELGLRKAPRDGVLAYALPARGAVAEATAEERLRVLVRDLPFEVHEAGLLLVLRTLPGSAHALANALDRTPWPEVVGTIAGDDTVFLACRDRASRQAVQQRLTRLAHDG